jgi:hypothetical protein
MKHSDIKMDKKVAKKAIGMHDKQMHGGKKTNLDTLKKGGMAVKKMAMGGMAKPKSRLADAEQKIGAYKMKALYGDEYRGAEAPNFKSKRARSDGSLQATTDTPKKESFGEAFKRHKKAGDSTFTFNGKSYTTETAAEKAKAKPKAKDTESDTPTPTGNIGSRVMFEEGETAPAFRKGGKAKCMARGGGCEVKGKTRGRII